MMIYISKLKELNKTSVNIAGGKGASLGEMLNSENFAKVRQS